MDRRAFLKLAGLVPFVPLAKHLPAIPEANMSALIMPSLGVRVWLVKDDGEKIPLETAGPITITSPEESV